MSETVCFDGFPPVDAALWRRFVIDPANQPRADYELLPEPFRAVVDRRLAHEARRDRRAALVRQALCLDPLTDAFVAGIAPAERAWLLERLSEHAAAIDAELARRQRVR